MLICVLKELDKLLTCHYKVIIAGGAAMIIHYGASRATRDVDAIIEGGNLYKIRDAARKIADKFNLNDNWFNDSIKGFANILPPDFQERTKALQIELSNIEIYAIGIAEQLIMKIIALREQDLEDIEILLPKLTEEDKQVVLRDIDHISKTRPDWAQKIQYFLEEQQWKIK